MVAQAPLVIGDGDDDFARAQAAMAARERAGAHAGDFERHDLFAQQRHHPADGPDEARAALAGPIHGLGEVDAEDDAGQRLRQNVLGGAPRNLPDEAVIFALGRGFDGQRLRRHALLARETGDRLRRGGFGRAENALFAIRPGAPASPRRAAPGGAAWRRASPTRAGSPASRTAGAGFRAPCGIIQSGISSQPISSRKGSAHWATSAVGAESADRPRPAPRRPPACARAG